MLQLPAIGLSQESEKSNNEKIELLSNRIDDLQSELKAVTEHNNLDKGYQEVFEKFQDKIVDERSSHQSFVETTFSNFISYIQTVISVAGIIFVVLTFFLGHNVRKFSEEYMKKKLIEAEKNIQNYVGEFKSKLESVAGTLDVERSYLKQNITYIRTINSTESFNVELDLLRNAGFSVKNISRPSPEFLNLENLKDTDILLISADEKDDLVSFFESINNHINLSANKTPIIIYCKGRLDTFNQLLERHPWVVVSNMPLTIINSVFIATKFKSIT